MLNALGTVTSLAEARRRREQKLDAQRKPRVLFIAEDMTLAHVGRMVALASSLDASHYDVTLACGERYGHLVRQAGLRHVTLWSMSPSYFADRLAQGRAVHTKKLLERYVADDLALLGREKPDLVVGDFRISLGISAEVAEVPYAAVANAYWSPMTALRFPVPEHPAVRAFGLSVASVLARVIRPLTFKLYLRPFNALRRRYGLLPLSSLFEMYTHADWTLYPDIPELAPVRTMLPGHSYLGAVSWEPPTALPSWWDELPQDKPIVYLSVGSSGAKGIFAAVVEALGDEDVTVIAATAGGDFPADLPLNFYVAPYLPGTKAAARADLVICNGGSGTVYQALAQGKPVLGIPANADQYLTSERVCALVAGELIRSGRVTAVALRRAVRQILDAPVYRRRAAQLATQFAAVDALQAFRVRVASCLSSTQHAASRRLGAGNE